MKFALGLIVAFFIGAACRYFELPAPAPPMLQGAILVVAMTLGFTLTDRAVSGRVPAPVVVPAAAAPRVDPPTSSEQASDTPTGTGA